MCIAPITIKNPYHRLGGIGLNAFHDTSHAYIRVPCGHCVQCVAMRQGFFLQRVQMESLRSHLFMFTLTYNDESLVFTDVGEYQIAYPVISDVQNLFKRLRKSGHTFRVTYSSEYGKKHFRPHFHGILAIDKSLGTPRTLERKYSRLLSSEWRRNYATTYNKNGQLVVNTRCPDWRPLFTPVRGARGRCATYDFHFIEPVRDHDNDVSYYVSKYITKYDQRTHNLLLKILQDDSLSDGETGYLYSLIKPQSNTSKDFGSWKYPPIFEYISKCAARETCFRFPQYYDIYTGKQMPMSPYYGKRIDTFAHLYNRLTSSCLADELSTVFYQDLTPLDYEQLSDSNLLHQLEFERKIRKMADSLLDL